jgi:tetratricopeptide (TPR) repeat protein
VKLVVCGLTAVVLTLVGEPFLLWDPDLLFGDDDLKRFAQAMNVAQGEIVRIWTLYDFSTTPYLFFITHLFRYAMGLPLEIAALAGLALAARSRNRGWLPILLWLGIYFLLVGRLHTKPIRYTTPMLPFLSISAAAACIWAGARIRAWGRLSTAFSYALPIALIGIPTSMYGLAMAGVFQKKDSRLEAVKWIRENIPPGDKVLTERGGFSTQWMVPPDRYDRSVDEATFFIMTEGQYLYRDKVDFFAKKLKNVPWIAIVEENRLRQYREAREAFPIGWEYYTRLENGTLGYNRAATFKVSPQIPGWVFDETEAEPTVTAFDHPRVSVYKRGNTDVDSMLASWREDTAANPLFPDPFVREGVKAFQDGDFVAAEGAFRKALGPRPDFKLGHLLMFETFKQQGLRDSAAVHLQAARGKDGLRREILVGFIKTGMRREAIVYLHGYVTTIEIKDSRDMYLVRFAAQTWFDLGVESFSNRSFDQAAADFLKAVELVPDFAPTHMNLGNLYLKLEDFEASRQHLNRVIELDSTQAEPHYRLAQGARMEERYAEARIHIRKALVMEPGRRLYLQELTRQGVVLYEAGRHEEAVSWYQEVLLTLPESSETLHNLGLALFSLGRYPDARVPFEAAAQLAPAQAATRFSLGRTYEMLGLKDQAISSYWTALELEPGNRDAQGRLEALGIGSDS